MSRVLVACATCSTPFEPTNRGGTTARYCSNPCREHARAIGRAKGVEKALEAFHQKRPSPEAWDGKTKYSSTPPLVEVFRVYCVLCGDEEYYRKTQAEVRRMRSPSPCQRCGGTRWIEPDGGARVGSATQPQSDGAGLVWGQGDPVSAPLGRYLLVELHGNLAAHGTTSNVAVICLKQVPGVATVTDLAAITQETLDVILL